MPTDAPVDVETYVTPIIRALRSDRRHDAASAHPAPSTMAREGVPGDADATLRSREEQSATRIAYAAGAAAERARVAADMRGRSRIRASEAEAYALTFPQPESSGAELRGASIELAEYADELEGKVQPPREAAVGRREQSMGEAGDAGADLRSGAEGVPGGSRDRDPRPRWRAARRLRRQGGAVTADDLRTLATSLAAQARTAGCSAVVSVGYLDAGGMVSYHTAYHGDALACATLARQGAALLDEAVGIRRAPIVTGVGGGGGGAR